MRSRFPTIPALIVFVFFLLIMNVAMAAEPADKPSPPPAATAAPAPAVHPTASAKTPAPAPDVRALSPKEVAMYRAQADSTSRSPQVQQLNVGSDVHVNTTIVVSVLLALVIFAVLVAVL